MHLTSSETKVAMSRKDVSGSLPHKSEEELKLMSSGTIHEANLFRQFSETALLYESTYRFIVIRDIALFLQTIWAIATKKYLYLKIKTYLKIKSTFRKYH